MVQCQNMYYSVDLIPCPTFKSFAKRLYKLACSEIGYFPYGFNVDQHSGYINSRRVAGRHRWTPEAASWGRPSLNTLETPSCGFLRHIHAFSSYLLQGLPVTQQALSSSTLILSLWDHISYSVATQPPPWRQVLWPQPLPTSASCPSLVPWVCCALLYVGPIQGIPCIYASCNLLLCFLLLTASLKYNMSVTLKGTKFVTDRITKLKWGTKSKCPCKRKCVLSPLDPFRRSVFMSANHFIVILFKCFS